MSELIYIILAVAVVVIGTIFIPKLYRNGKLSDEIVDGFKKAINIAELILASIEIDEEKKKAPTFILDMADIVADYVAALEIVDDKEQLSLDVIQEVLGKLGIAASESEQKLIQIIVQEALDFAEKQQ